LKSIFSITNPEQEFSWDDLEKLTDYLPGHGAWVYAELLTLNGYGLNTKLITGFNIKRFIKEGFSYIEDEFGKDIADYEREHPHNFKKIKRQMQESLDKELVINRTGKTRDIKDFIDEGWYVMLLVNSKALNSKSGYTGHRVLVFGYDDKGVIMHDPGPNNGGPDAHVSWERLQKAWPKAKELIAVKQL